MERKLSHSLEVNPSSIHLIKNWRCLMENCVLLLYLQVQTRQWACDNKPFPKGGHNGAGRISCNCGVVLRDHNDVIEFSCCNVPMVRDRRTPITVKIRSKKCLSPGISIRNVMPGVNGKYEVSTRLLKIHGFRQFKLKAQTRLERYVQEILISFIFYHHQTKKKNYRACDVMFFQV